MQRIWYQNAVTAHTTITRMKIPSQNCRKEPHDRPSGTFLLNISHFAPFLFFSNFEKRVTGIRFALSEAVMKNLNNLIKTGFYKAWKELGDKCVACNFDSFEKIKYKQNNSHIWITEAKLGC